MISGKQIFDIQNILKSIDFIVEHTRTNNYGSGWILNIKGCFIRNLNWKFETEYNRYVSNTTVQHSFWIEGTSILKLNRDPFFSVKSSVKELNLIQSLLKNGRIKNYKVKGDFKEILDNNTIDFIEESDYSIVLTGVNNDLKIKFLIEKEVTTKEIQQILLLFRTFLKRIENKLMSF